MRRHAARIALGPQRTGAALACIVGLAMASWGLAGGVRSEYRMQVTVGPTTHWGMGATRFASLVQEKTQGRIRVKPYFASQLLRGAQLNAAPMVAMGAIDLALDSTINMAPTLPEMNVFCLPFLVKTYENVDRMEAGQTGRLLFQAMEAKGIKPLGWGENGFRWITNSKRKISGPEDLRGLKIRVVGSPMFMDFFRALGADPVDMNWGDAVSAFQQGAVDGGENPAGILISVSIDRYHRQLTLWRYAIDPLVFCWNKAEFDAFPQDIQCAILEAAQEAGRYQKALARAGLDQGRSLEILNQEFNVRPDVQDPAAHFEARGVEVTPWTPERERAFEQASRAVREEWMRRIGPNIQAACQADIGGP